MESYFRRYERQWGYYECLVPSLESYQVKRLTLFSGKATSIQNHAFRRESWIVVSGTGEALVGEKITNISSGSTVDVPKTAIHQIRNSGSEDLILIEVQTGSYLGEDDIVRYTELPL